MLLGAGCRMLRIGRWVGFVALLAGWTRVGCCAAARSGFCFRGGTRTQSYPSIHHQSTLQFNLIPYPTRPSATPDGEICPCAAGNASCYCTSPDFRYGIRDCANEACPNSSDAATVVSWTVQYCGVAGVYHVLQCARPCWLMCAQRTPPAQ